MTRLNLILNKFEPDNFLELLKDKETSQRKEFLIEKYQEARRMSAKEVRGLAMNFLIKAHDFGDVGETPLPPSLKMSSEPQPSSHIQIKKSKVKVSSIDS